MADEREVWLKRVNACLPRRPLLVASLICIKLMKKLLLLKILIILKLNIGAQGGWSPPPLLHLRKKSRRRITKLSDRRTKLPVAVASLTTTKIDKKILRI